MKKNIFLTFIFCIATILSISAQSRPDKVQLILVPNHSNALYLPGESVSVKVIAIHCGLALNDVEINYQVSEDMMTPHIDKNIKLKGNEGKINIGTMKRPGFLRLKATVEYEGKKYSTLSTVGFSPEKLTPTVTQPDDFKAFWDKNVETVKWVELKPEMTLLPERCTDKVNVYHISYQNINRTRMYGMLTIPKAPGKYPAVLRLPGAGVSEKSGDIPHAERGLIVLELGIHGIPVNLQGSTYSDLSNGVLASYPLYNLDNKYSYFYRRVYLGCVKGVEFLLNLPECNGKIGTIGGSQGGALSIVTSALEPRVSATAIYFPALCDLEGYTHNRAGGWPPVFKNPENCTPEKLNTARYYDASNFARNLTAPVFYAFGYNDITCAPTTTYSTYNVITAEKQLSIGENTGHWLFTEQVKRMWDWLIDTLQK